MCEYFHSKRNKQALAGQLQVNLPGGAMTDGGRAPGRLLPFRQDKISIFEAGQLPQGVDLYIFLAVVVT